MVVVHRWALGPLRANCYVIVSSGEAIIVDPGWHEDVIDIIRFIDSNKLKIKGIIATHGHFDHVSGVSIVKNYTNAPFMIHEGDLEIARRAHRSAYRYIGVEPPQVPEPDILVSERFTVEIGDVKLRVIETPGHTMGSISIVAPGEVFTGDLLLEASRAISRTAYDIPVVLTGDTLFKGTIGRVDLPGSSPQSMISSLRKLSKLPLKTIIYPGHGPETTLEEEIKNNQYLRAVLESS
ncbi:MAG: MBL fold metallo-hydrolase [Acidilobaceae archaeon]